MKFANYFMNQVPDILLSKKFFEKRSIFRKTAKNDLWGDMDCFEGKWASGEKNQYKLFCKK